MGDRPRIDLSAFPELAGWLGDGPDDPRFFVNVEVSVGRVAAVMALLAPPFVEYRGSVLLGFRHSPSNVDHWCERLGDASAVERMVNHTHLWGLFPGQSSAGVEELAEPLAWFWGAALRAAYPAREFRVEHTRDGGYGPEVTFWEVRDANDGPAATTSPRPT